MTVIYGLDGSTPPALDALVTYKNKGYAFFAGYIHGNTPVKWSREQLLRVPAAGLELLVISVAPYGNDLSRDLGVQHGNEVLVAMQQLGIGGTVALDIENGATPVEYVHGFGDAVIAGFASMVLYGAAITLVACAGPAVDSYWLAYWPEPAELVPAAPPDWDIWQFESGWPCDLNAARPDFKFTLITSDP